MVGYDGVFTDEGIEATSNGDLLGERNSENTVGDEWMIFPSYKPPLTSGFSQLRTFDDPGERIYFSKWIPHLLTA